MDYADVACPSPLDAMQRAKKRYMCPKEIKIKKMDYAIMT